MYPIDMKLIFTTFKILMKKCTCRNAVKIVLLRLKYIVKLVECCHNLSINKWLK